MADLQASVAAWVGAIRIATSPATRIVVIVPFGGSIILPTFAQFPPLLGTSARSRHRALSGGSLRSAIAPSGFGTPLQK
jgi:hypothetical protein